MVLVKPTEIQIENDYGDGDKNHFVKFKYIVKWK